VQQLEQDLESYKSSYEQMSAEMQGKDDSIKELQDANKEYEEAYNQLDQDYKASISDAEAEKKRADTLERRCKTLEDSTKFLEAGQTRDKETISTLQSSVTSLKQDLKDFTRKEEKLNSLLNESKTESRLLEEKIESLKESNDRLKRTAADAESESSRLRLEVGRIDNALREKEDQCRGLERERARWEADLERYQKQISRMETSINHSNVESRRVEDLLAQIDDLIKGKEDLHQELRQSEGLAHEHQRKVVELNRKLESIQKVQTEKERLEEEVKRLTHRLANVEPFEKPQDRPQAQEKLRDAQEIIAALQGEKRALLEELELLQDSSRTGGDKMQLHALRAENQALVGELESATRKYDALEQKFKESVKTPVSRLKRPRSNSVLSNGSNDSVPKNDDDVEQYLQGLERGDADALEQLKQIVLSSQQELLRLAEVVEQANEKEMEWEGQMSKLQTQVTLKTEEAQSLREQMVKLRTRFDSHDLQLKKKEMEVEACKDQIDELNDLLTSADENREASLQDLREVIVF
jgi:chromosome segregation ATPase